MEYCIGVHHSVIDSERLPVVVLKFVHLRKVLVHLLIVLVVIKSLQLHLQLSLLRLERLKLGEGELEFLLEVVSLEYYVLKVQGWLAHYDGPARDSVIVEVNDVCGERIAACSLRLNLLLDGLFVRLLLNEQILHIVDERAGRLLFGNLKGQSLQFGEIALPHVDGVLVRLQQRLECSDGVRLLLTVLQLLIDDSFVHLLEEQDLALQLILFFSGLLEIGVKLLVLLYQHILQFLQRIDCLVVSGFLLAGHVHDGAATHGTLCRVKNRRLDLLIDLKRLLQLADLLLQNLVLLLEVRNLLRLVVLRAKRSRRAKVLIAAICGGRESIASCVIREI